MAKFLSRVALVAVGDRVAVEGEETAIVVGRFEDDKGELVVLARVEGSVDLFVLSGVRLDEVRSDERPRTTPAREGIGGGAY